MPARLRAALTVTPTQGARPEDFRARCELVNEGDEPAIVNLAPLASPSLALEITEEGGQPLLLPPPPVPHATVPTATLAPGEAEVADLGGFLPAWTPPGRYRVRFRYSSGSGAGRWLEAELRSDWVSFRLG